MIKSRCNCGCGGGPKGLEAWRRAEDASSSLLLRAAGAIGRSQGLLEAPARTTNRRRVNVIDCSPIVTVNKSAPAAAARITPTPRFSPAGADGTKLLPSPRRRGGWGESEAGRPAHTLGLSVGCAESKPTALAAALAATNLIQRRAGERSGRVARGWPSSICARQSRLMMGQYFPSFQLAP